MHNALVRRQELGVVESAEPGRGGRTGRENSIGCYFCSPDTGLTSAATAAG